MHNKVRSYFLVVRVVPVCCCRFAEEKKQCLNISLHQEKIKFALRVSTKYAVTHDVCSISPPKRFPMPRAIAVVAAVASPKRALRGIFHDINGEPNVGEQ